MISKNKRTWRAIPRPVWALGFVGLFMDISSEMIHALVPLFLVVGLGASMAIVGLIEGIAEATAAITKVFSGALSDWLGKRKFLAGIGYALGALTKPVFPLAATATEVLMARFIDRIGKGIRGAPRDALIADITPPETRGAAYGLRQGLDTAGAFIGPLAAIGLLMLLDDDLRAVLWWAAIPAFIAVLLFFLGVEEPPGEKIAREARRLPIKRADLQAIDKAYWGVLVVGAVFTLARFSEAFLILRAEDVGLPLALAPAVMVVMNFVYAIVAAPAGALSDRMDRRWVLAIGLGALIIADSILALVPTIWGVMAGVALWGVYMGLTQGLLSALVADTAPKELRGTAFGAFNLVTGIALFAASALAGLLWAFFGPEATFLTGAAFAAAALIGLVLVLRRPKSEALANKT